MEYTLRDSLGDTFTLYASLGDTYTLHASLDAQGVWCSEWPLSRDSVMTVVYSDSGLFLKEAENEIVAIKTSLQQYGRAKQDSFRENSSLAKNRPFLISRIAWQIYF